MPSVNMIAARRAEKDRLNKLTGIMLVVILGELAITLALFSFMTARAYTAGCAVRRLDQQLEKIQPTVDKIRHYETEIELLEPRLRLLEDSKRETLLWHTVLQDLSRSLPEKTWLTSLAATKPVTTGSDDEAKAPTVLSLRGVSVSQMLVGETMLRLNRFPEFERVDLNYTQEGSDRELDTVDFQVSVLLKSNEPQKGGGSKNAQH